MVLPDRLAAMLHVALREVLRLLRHQLPEVVQVAELVAEAALRFLHPSLEMLGMASRLVLHLGWGRRQSVPRFLSSSLYLWYSLGRSCGDLGRNLSRCG